MLSFCCQSRSQSLQSDVYLYVRLSSRTSVCLTGGYMILATLISVKLHENGKSFTLNNNDNFIG